jgi:hypothetical protein
MFCYGDLNHFASRGFSSRIDADIYFGDKLSKGRAKAEILHAQPLCRRVDLILK